MKKILSLLLVAATLVSTLTVFFSCSKDENQEENKVTIVENKTAYYTLIRADKLDEGLLNKIIDMQRTIMNECACSIKLNSDWVRSTDDIDPNAKEILIGNTNRPETAEVLKTLEPNSWAIVDKGNKIVICANNDGLISVAIDWFLDNCVNSKEKTVKITEKIAKTEGYGDGLLISASDVSGYQVVYPKGNETLEYYASLIQREANVKNAVTDDKAETDYEIVLGNTNRKNAVSFTTTNEYSISTEDSKVYITASNDDTLYYALNYYLEYGITVSDTIVSAPADYEKNGTLYNYFSSKWDLCVPYMEEGRIAPAYNTGTGLADDTLKDTVEDSYVHLVTNATYEMFENYANKLESFGFKRMHTAKTENNELLGYSLGAAYVYMHYSPLQKSIRVTWDKSSNCKPTQVQYTAEYTGTTTFYQYSLEHENAKLNYTGGGSTIGMFYIIKLQDNSLILVDGGGKNQAKHEALYDFLYQITGTDKKDPIKIRMWYITHPDSDHYYGANYFLEYLDQNNKIMPDIDCVAYNFPGKRANSTITKHGPYYFFVETLKKCYPDINYLKLHTGMVLNFGEVKFEVLGTIENLVSNKGVIPDDYSTNDTCSFARFYFGGRSAIMTGDIGTAMGDHMKLYSDEYFKSDILQVEHHGININAEIQKYDKLCAPKYALVPTNIESAMNIWNKQYQYRLTAFKKSEQHYAGDYTTAIEVTNGEMTLKKIARHDHPTGVLE